MQMPSQRTSFFPKADATVLQSSHAPPSPNSRPTTVGPILDVEHANAALNTWSVEVVQSVYPSSSDIWAPAPVPDTASCPQECTSDRYLFPVLTRDERLRLTMLFYYTRGVLDDLELMSRLQEKVLLARETVGWEFAIAGLLDQNTYTRMVTVGLPLAVLPRRESTCAHTVNQPPGVVFSLLNMVEDWRFKSSPHVEHGGLRAYAGVPLRFETEFGQHVAFGSLCVASNSPQETLSKEQQRSLARLADWIVADIIHSARQRRQRERKRMQEALGELQSRSKEGFNMENAVQDVLQSIYPNTSVHIYITDCGQIALDGGAILQVADLEHGLWEDCAYFDYLIEEMNHTEMLAPKTVRVIAAQCISQHTPTYLTVSSCDFRQVFDDVDSWFVNMCAGMLCRYWQDQALHEARAAKELFLRGITHQLRTPIHGILGSAELLTEELKARNLLPITATSPPKSSSGAEQQDPYVYIRTIRSSARELIFTVNSLIKLNQWTGIAEAERDFQVHEFSEIEALLANEIKTSMPDDTVSKPTLVFTSKCVQACNLISIDINLLVDCILPLIVNAVQNTPGGVVAVTFSYNTDTRRFLVDIEDNGCGIPESEQQRIFEAYRKVDSTTADAGLGLTLACKSASLLGGKITLLRSAMNTGSHFRASFAEQVYASSWPRKRLCGTPMKHLPDTYHLVTPIHQVFSLASKIGLFLESKGISRSENSNKSILLLDYSGDVEQLHQYLSEIPSQQLVVCIVPDGALCSLVSDHQPTYIHKNIIYTRGPFSSDTLDNLLVAADQIVEEISTSQGSTATMDVTTQHGCSRIPGTYKLSNGVVSELAQSIKQLGIAATKTPPITPSPRLLHESHKPMTLLVDDNTVNLRILELYCNRRSIPYQIAKNGNEAVELFCLHRKAPENTVLQQPVETRPFDLVLMDLQMPLCDGLEATRQIRELEKSNGWPQSIVCMVTGQDSPSDRIKATEVGSNWYLVKPVGPKALDRWIKQWFSGIEF